VGSLPRGVWVLGFVSLLMDSSSELVHSLLPLLLTTVLGASMVTVGLIEGAAEACAAILKAFSGMISDRIGKRKVLVVVGYGLAALTKPIFPLAQTIGWVFTARFVDRMGKGIRGAPRDALVADITPAELRGSAYGLRQALDSAGALVGPLLAVLFMFWLAGDIRLVLWVAAVPAAAAVLLLFFGLTEPPGMKQAVEARPPVRLRDVNRLSGQYWLVILLGTLFTLARFSEAFLILRAEDTGLALGFVPVVMIVMNMVYAGAAYPAGIASDRYPVRAILIFGLATLIAADVLLAIADTPLTVFAGAALWGLHMGLTQGLFSKLVADTAPDDLRGSAFGIFNLVTGVALLIASVVAGALWSVAGPAATFAAGALFATLAMVGVVRYRSTL